MIVQLFLVVSVSLVSAVPHNNGYVTAPPNPTPPQPTCPPNEVYVGCTPGCESTCEVPAQRYCHGCPEICLCAQGYARDNYGRCLSVSYCSQPAVSAGAPSPTGNPNPTSEPPAPTTAFPPQPSWGPLPPRGSTSGPYVPGVEYVTAPPAYAAHGRK